MFQAQTKVVHNRFHELFEQAQAAAQRRNVELAEQTLELAKNTVHVVSGKTRDSGRVVIRRGAASVEFSEGAVFEELGTRFRAPHSFLRPSAEQVAKAMRNRSFRLYRG